MNVNIDIDRILEAGAKAVDTAKKTATDLAREGKRQTDLLALQGKKAKAERQKAHKYVCPICGQEVRSTSELSLICGVCEVPMTCED